MNSNSVGMLIAAGEATTLTVVTFRRPAYLAPQVDQICLLVKKGHLTCHLFTKRPAQSSKRSWIRITRLTHSPRTPTCRSP